MPGQLQPVLVCLDDLQWADTVTMLALRLLPSRLASHPIAWILARSRGSRGSHAEALFGLLAHEGATLSTSRRSTITRWRA